MATSRDTMGRFGVAWSTAAQVLYTVPSRVLSRLNGRFVTRLPSTELNGEKTVFLTFDDGPTTDHTHRLLEMLARYEAHASFFLTTENVAANEEAVRAISTSGHAVGIHGHTHADPWFQRAAALQENLERSRLIVQGLLDVDVHWLRPAYGHVRPATFRFARRHDMQIACWDVMPGDYVRGIDARTVFQRMATGVRPGSVVVLHDNERVEESGVTLQALDLALRYFADRGWRFAPLPVRTRSDS